MGGPEAVQRSRMAIPLSAPGLTDHLSGRTLHSATRQHGCQCLLRSSTPCAVWTAFSDITMVPRRCPGACRGEEGRTADARRSAAMTQMVRSPGHGVSREPVSVQPRSAFIRLICVHLRFPLLCRGRHGRGSGARRLVSVRASRWCLGLSRSLLRRRRANRGCTRISSNDADGGSPNHGVSREPVPVQPRSACIRLIRVHLRFPLLCRGRHRRGGGVQRGGGARSLRPSR
jgi:hypothetical protein